MWLTKLYKRTTILAVTIFMIVVYLIAMLIEWVYVKCTGGYEKEPEIAGGDPMMCVINDEEE